LFEAYSRLHEHTQERAWARRSPAVQVLRQVQMAVALENALKLEPDTRPTQKNLAEIHHMLAEFYGHTRMFDLSVMHREEELKYLRNVQAALREPDDNLDRLVDQIAKMVEQLDQQMQNQMNLFEVRSNEQKTPLGKARMALGMGLVGRALSILGE